MKPKYELSEVLSLYGEDFLNNHSISYQKVKVLRAIVNCKTAALGGHTYKCGDCSHILIAYNSCRNRHCPSCQSYQRENWIEKQKAKVLPVKYFHVVFTIPSDLNGLCLQYPKELYNTLFYASWQTIKVFSEDPKHLGAQTGMTSILHTWGQNLSLHPHLHCLVPSGGLDKNGNWKTTKSKGKYLFPVKAMSIVFRSIFLKRLKALYKSRKIYCNHFELLKEELYKKSWVVYSKRPFVSVSSVIEYIGRYTHKIAISNHRIKQIGNGKVAFSYKNYRTNKNAEMCLSSGEFLRRFTQHILPKGFVRIRHYGLFAGVNKYKLDVVRAQLPEQSPAEDLKVKYPNWKPQEGKCPKCKKGKLCMTGRLPRIRAGPTKVLIQWKN